MKVVRMSAGSIDSLVERRRSTGAGRLDECWEGVWHLTDATARHQQVSGRLFRIHSEVIEDSGRGTCWISINVTDREHRWIDNHRCPDGAVILNGNPGRWLSVKQVAFLGGPDLILEVTSDDDDINEKLPFHAERKVREVLVVDQHSERPELYRLEQGALTAVSGRLHSLVTGLEYSQGPEGLAVLDPGTGRSWAI